MNENKIMALETLIKEILELFNSRKWNDYTLGDIKQSKWREFEFVSSQYCVVRLHESDLKNYLYSVAMERATQLKTEMVKFVEGETAEYLRGEQG